MVESIHRETQLVDQTGRSVYEELGLFVLVITSHGAEGSVAGSDHRHIKLTDIYLLLPPKNFPAMRGKPKLIIFQACAGGMSILATFLIERSLNLLTRQGQPATISYKI